MQGWASGIFATLWILLAAASGMYLYGIATDPAAIERIQASFTGKPAAAAAPEAQAPAPAQDSSGPAMPPPLSADQAAALMRKIDSQDRQIAELTQSLRGISGQLAEFSGRLKPIEKILGPVAALPSSTAVTTSPPVPSGLPQSETPAAPKPEASSPPASAPEPSSTPSGQTQRQSAAEPPAASPPAAAAPSGTEQGRTSAPDSPAAPAPDTEESAAPAPDADEAASPEESPDSEESETALINPAPNLPAGTTRFGIELGSVEKMEGVRPMWRKLLTNHAALVAGLQARRIIAPDKKWRLIAGPFASAAEALQACVLFRKANLPCEATVFAGDAL